MDIKSVIRDNLLRNYVVIMSNLLKHANYLNTVLKSLKTRCSYTINCRGLMNAMKTAGLTNLCLALSFILTVVSTGQKSSELLFTLTLGSYYRRTETLFEKRNTEHQ